MERCRRQSRAQSGAFLSPNADRLYYWMEQLEGRELQRCLYLFTLLNQAFNLKLQRENVHNHEGLEMEAFNCKKYL